MSAPPRFPQAGLTIAQARASIRDGLRTIAAIDGFKRAAEAGHDELGAVAKELRAQGLLQRGWIV